MTSRRLPSSPKGLDAIPGQRQVDGQMLAMIVALASESVIMRARLDTYERLLIEANVFKIDAIDTFSPDPAAQAEREQLRIQTLNKIFRPLQEAAAADLASFTEPTPTEKHV